MIELSAGQIADIVSGELFGDKEVTVNGICTDSRNVTKGDLFVALRGERFDANDFLPEIEGRAGIAIGERFEEVSYPIIVVKDSLEALTTLARYYSKNVMSTSVNLSVTGSVGKTTTKEMISSVLATTYKTAYTKGNLNNHIGVPLTLLSVEKDDGALVCEMGMSHKGEISHLASMLDSDIAVITNIGHSHIENLGSREGIRDAKLELLEGLKKDGTLVINGDEPLLDDVAFEGRIIRVGMNEKCDLWADNVQMGEDSVRYNLHASGKIYEITLSCTGRHNVMNSLFAIATGFVLGIDIEKIQSGLLNYKSVGLRQNIYFKNSVRVIADCYNAGIESMTASVRMLSELKCDGRRIAVLSDMLELGEVAESAHLQIGSVVADSGIDVLFTTGKNAKLTFEKASSMGIKAYHFETKEELAEAIKSTLGEGDTILFKASRSMKLEEVIKLADLEN